MKTYALLLPLVLVLAACPHAQDPITPRPVPPSDPSWCKPAGERLTTMKCPWAKNADNKGFADICLERHAAGIDLHAECIATDTEVKTCADFNWACGCAKTDLPCRKELGAP